MTTLWAEQALTASGWQNNIRIDIDERGRIELLQSGAEPQGTLRKDSSPGAGQCP